MKTHELPLALAACGLAAAGSAARAAVRPPTLDPTYGLPVPRRTRPEASLPAASWIWAAHGGGTQTVSARRAFGLAQLPKTAFLFATGDDSVAVWLNGQKLIDAPALENGWKTTKTASVARLLRRGKNVLAVQGTNQGAVGAILAELVAEGKPLLRTDTSWKLLESPAPPSNWISAAFNDAAWANATAIAPLGQGPWGSAVEGWPGDAAGAWYLAHKTLLPVAIEMLHGVVAFTRTGNAKGAPLTIGPGAGGAPAQVLVDFGQELAGRLVLRGTEGAALKIRTGEWREACFHAAPALDNGGPFELKLSAQSDITTPYSAFRYALISFPDAHAVSLSKLQLDHKYYPVAYDGSFSCSDPLLTRVWYTGAYTAHACMQEEIWDAPKRDRGLWSGDLLPTGKTIDVAFGDDFLMQHSLSELRRRTQGQKPDEALPDDEINGIPGYSATWLIALADYYRYRGGAKFLQSQHKLIVSLLEFQKTDFDADNLFFNPRNKWTFVDWASGVITQSPEGYRATHLMIVRGVREAVFLLRELGDSANADKYEAWASTLTEAARRNYLDAATSTYGPRLQTNSMALYSGTATPEQQAAIFEKILRAGSPTWKMGTPYTNTDAYAMTPYFGFYVLDNLGALGRQQQGLDLIRRYWGGMIERGATTFWEKFDPGFPGPKTVLDNMPYISLCHGWSSGPTSYLSEQVLGVRPTSAGFKTAEIAPFLGDLQWAQGTVPTPRGILKVRAEKTGAGQAITLTLPSGVRAKVKLRGAHIMLNARPAPATRLQNGDSTVEINRDGVYRFTTAN